MTRPGRHHYSMTLLFAMGGDTGQQKAHTWHVRYWHHLWVEVASFNCFSGTAADMRCWSFLSHYNLRRFMQGHVDLGGPSVLHFVPLGEVRVEPSVEGVLLGARDIHPPWEVVAVRH